MREFPLRLAALAALACACTPSSAARTPHPSARAMYAPRLVVVSDRAPTPALSAEAASHVTELLTRRVKDRLWVVTQSDVRNFLSSGEQPPYDDSYVRQIGQQLRADVILEVTATSTGDSVTVDASFLRPLGRTPPTPLAIGTGPDVRRASQRLVNALSLDALVALSRDGGVP